MVHTSTCCSAPTRGKGPHNQDGYARGVVRIGRMTIVEEAIFLMQRLQEPAALYQGGMTKDDKYKHLPEYFREENQDYGQWELEIGVTANGSFNT